jgi:hypothetical protein
MEAFQPLRLSDKTLLIPKIESQLEETIRRSYEEKH